MKNLQLIKLIIGVIIISTVVIGCSKAEETPDKPKEETTKEISKKEYETKEMDEFEITLKNAEIKEENIKLDMEVKNLAKKERLFDGLVLTVKNKEGKELQVAAENHLSNTIKNGKTIKGSVYFKVEGTAPFTIYYNDLEELNEELWTLE